MGPEGSGLKISENGQEWFVLDTLNYKRNGYFIDIGAGDGIVGSNTFILEKFYDWSGVCVDPNPAFFKSLIGSRDVSIVDLSVDKESGKVKPFLYANEKDFFGWNFRSGLKEVRSYVWLDLIFVNINNNEIPFEKYIKPLSDRWKKFWPIKDRELIKYSNDFGYFNLNAKCNWKFAIENYCESYHLPWVHPGLNSYSKIDDHYHIQGLPNRFAGQGTIVYNPRFKGKEKFPCFPNWPKDKEHIAEYVALFPNVMLGIHKDHFYAYWLEPVNSEYTKEHMEIYYVGEEAANSKKFKSLRKQNFELWKGVQSEDLNIIEGMQDGRKSPSYNGGNFSPVMDNPTHHFHKWVANNLMS